VLVNVVPKIGLHLRKGDQFIEVLLTDWIGDEVLFRRDPSIRMLMSDFIRTDSQGRQYVTPEWQLLFKSKEDRDKDRQDLKSFIAHGNAKRRAWLLAACRQMGCFVPSKVTEACPSGSDTPPYST